MTVKKRKKVAKYRGSTTHGGGSMKKRRGAGHRGGRGKAGGGKRADQNKPTFLKLYGNTYFGKKGFVRKNKRVIKATTLAFLDKKFNNLLEKKLIKEEKGLYVVNLKDLGFDKLLATGVVTKKFKITANQASKKAVEKIEKAGGSVEVLEGSEEEWEDVSAEEEKKE